MESFKPCYKWNTFNTPNYGMQAPIYNGVLNLVISGIPSIHDGVYSMKTISLDEVLNLVISGIPSIPKTSYFVEHRKKVLNLVISGIPSIRFTNEGK